jgi:hypothetical protein
MKYLVIGGIWPISGRGDPQHIVVVLESGGLRIESI